MSKSDLLVQEINSISAAFQRVDKEHKRNIDNLFERKNKAKNEEKAARDQLQNRLNSEINRFELSAGASLGTVDSFRQVIENEKRMTPPGALNEYNRLITSPEAALLFRPENPDLNELRAIKARIRDDTIWGFLKKTFSWRGYKPQKEMIKDYTLIIENGLMYADDLDRSLISSRDSQINAANNKYQSELLNRKNAFSATKSAIQNSEVDIENSYIDSLKKVLDGQTLTSLRQHVISTAKTMLIEPHEWAPYTKPSRRENEIAIGMRGVSIYLPRPVQKVAAERIKPFCVKNPESGNNTISVPLGISLNGPARILIKHTGSSKSIAVQGVLSFLSKLIRSIPPGDFDITYIDPIDRGSNLGVLQALTPEKLKGGVIFTPIASSVEQINSALKRVQDDIDAMSRALGNLSSMYEYNAHAKKKMVNHYVVINDFPKNLSQTAYDALEVILNNADKCGVSLIISMSDQPLEKKDEPFIKLLDKMNRHPNSLQIVEKSKHFYIQPQGEPFRFETMKHVSAGFLRSVQDNYDTRIKLDNSFKSRVLASPNHKVIECGDVLKIPYAVDEANEVVSLTVGAQNVAHSMITGKNGSGKTTALHTIINSVVYNYSPNAVNLWLIDYAKVEFAKYNTLNYPHIKMIGLEDSLDFSYGLLDELGNEMSRRRDLFYNNNASSIFDYNKKQSDPSNYVPRLLVIIDEFHNLSNHIVEDRRPNKATGLSYKILLEKILLEARKLGISLFFSDQSGRDGLRGFTSKAGDQIHNWIAMMNTPEEINAALGMASGKYSDSQKEYIVKNRALLMPGEILLGETVNDDSDNISRATVNKYKVLFSTDEDAKLINSTYANHGTQQEKPLIVDSNKRRHFSKDEVVSHEKLNPIPSDVFCPIYLGTTLANMDRYYRLNLKAATSNNIMLIGSDADLRFSILKSTMRSFLRSSKNTITFWVDSNDQFYQGVKKELQEIAAKTNNRVSIYDTDSRICIDVMSLKEQVDKGIAINRMTIILGMEDLFDNLSYYPSTPLQEQHMSTPTVTQKAKTSDDALSQLSTKLDALLSEEEANIASQQETADSEEVDMRYDARNDIAYLETRGPKKACFQFVVLDQAMVLGKLRRFIDTDNFYHKLALRMSTDESMSYLGKSQLASSLNQIAAIYQYGGSEATEFKPFL